MEATVYLIHFERPYKHAKHYVGYTAMESLDDRLDRHRTGRGARLMQVVTEAGIDWYAVKTWTFKSIAKAKAKERQLKNHSGTRYCPVCQRKVHDNDRRKPGDNEA